jgi:hypothetical protein
LEDLHHSLSLGSPNFLVIAPVKFSAGLQRTVEFLKMSNVPNSQMYNPVKIYPAGKRNFLKVVF